MKLPAIVLITLSLTTFALPSVVALSPHDGIELLLLMRPPTHEECNYGDYPYVECCTVNDDTGQRYSCQWCDYETSPPECWEGH